VGFPLPRLAQIQHRERRQRRSFSHFDLTTTRRTCTTDVTAHTVLPFAPDPHFPRLGSGACDGLPVCAGGLLSFLPDFAGLDRESYTGRQGNARTISATIVSKLLNFFSEADRNTP
jgi:hypothetical protein